MEFYSCLGSAGTQHCLIALRCTLSSSRMQTAPCSTSCKHCCLTQCWAPLKLILRAPMWLSTHQALRNRFLTTAVAIGEHGSLSCQVKMFRTLLPLSHCGKGIAVRLKPLGRNHRTDNTIDFDEGRLALGGVSLHKPVVLFITQRLCVRRRPGEQVCPCDLHSSHILAGTDACPSVCLRFLSVHAVPTSCY